MKVSSGKEKLLVNPKNIWKLRLSAISYSNRVSDRIKLVCKIKYLTIINRACGFLPAGESDVFTDASFLLKGERSLSRLILALIMYNACLLWVLICFPKYSLAVCVNKSILFIFLLIFKKFHNQIRHLACGLTKEDFRI